MIFGIDLSHHNEPFDWDTLAPEIRFVIAKASEGNSYRDKTYLEHLSEARNRGITFGAYLFFDPALPAGPQIANYLARGTDFNRPGTLPPIIDIENGASDSWIEKNQKTAHFNLTDALTRLQDATRRTPIIYTYHGYWIPTFGNPTDFNKYPLWVACYKGIPQMFGGWDKYTIWQFSQRGSHLHPEDGGDVDWNRFDGTEEELKAL